MVGTSGVPQTVERVRAQGATELAGSPAPADAGKRLVEREKATASTASIKGVRGSDVLEALLEQALLQGGNGNAVVAEDAVKRRPIRINTADGQLGIGDRVMPEGPQQPEDQRHHPLENPRLHDSRTTALPTPLITPENPRLHDSRLGL